MFHREKIEERKRYHIEKTKVESKKNREGSGISN